MTATLPAFELTDEDREAAYLIGEELIPQRDGELSADQAGVSAEFLDQVLKLRPDLAPRFRSLVRRLQDQEPRAFCERLAADEPDQFQLLTFVLAGAYLMSPRVRARLKYKGQIGEPQAGEQQPEYMAGGLLSVVAERGPIYRATPS